MKTASDRRRYALAASAGFALVAARNLRPYLESNEAFYLLRGRRIVDPEFLQADWTANAAPWYRSLSVAFDVMVSGLWALLGDMVQVAVSGRLVVWILLMAAISQLVRSLGVRPWLFLAGFSLWLVAGQGFAAAEWIFGGLEQKCIAYAALFAALDAACRARAWHAGVFAGLAIAFHPLVGGWGAGALVLAVLVARRSPAECLRVAGPALLLGAPVLLLGVRLLFQPAPEGSDPHAANELLVLFRNPHHLDPAYFLGPRRGVLFALVLLTAAWSVHRIAAREVARVVVVFLAALGALYAAGIAARALGSFGLLNLYPFRVADVVAPLLLWLTLPQALLASGAAWWRRPSVPALLAPLLALAVLCWFGTDKLPRGLGHFASEVRATSRAWSGEPPGPKRTRPTVYEWIRTHTEPDAVFAVYPCRALFWIEAERAMIVNFKSAPPNSRVLEWHERLTALNGGKPFRKRTLGACQELSHNFSELTLEQLADLRTRFGADYYLVSRERLDLAPEPIHRRGLMHLYDLRQAPASSAR